MKHRLKRISACALKGSTIHVYIDMFTWNAFSTIHMDIWPKMYLGKVGISSNQFLYLPYLNVQTLININRLAPGKSYLVIIGLLHTKSGPKIKSGKVRIGSKHYQKINLLTFMKSYLVIHYLRQCIWKVYQSEILSNWSWLEHLVKTTRLA